MIQSLIRGLSRRVLPAPAVAALYLGAILPLAVEAVSYPRLWAVILLGLGIAAGLVSMLFSQWRTLGGLVLAGIAFYLHFVPLDTVSPSVAALASLILALGLAVTAAVPDRGFVSPAPAVALGLGLLVVATILRGPPDWLPDPALGLGSFSLGPHEWRVTLGALMAAVAALLALGAHLLSPSASTGALLGTLACLLPLGFGRPENELVLVLAGGTVLLTWTGLLTYAWHLAFVDELTGLPNRRALELRLRGRGQSMAMVDVDHFKGFNDRWGHDAGDQVLRRVAETLANIRGGRAYRYGGEEFTIVFRSRHVDRLRVALEDVRRRIAQHPFRLRTLRTNRRERGRGGGRDVRITASFGLAVPMRGESGEETLKRADGALYRAKRNGRNRLEIRE